MHPKHPRIEALLRDAHTAEKQLRTALGKLLTFGVAADDLPNHRDIFGLALLGDHERAEVVSQLRSHWPALQERGLVAELSPDDVPTPLLRLLVYTVNHLEEIPSLLDALLVDAAPTPAPEMFEAPEQIRGVYWGQRLSILFSANDTEAIRIHADEVLGFSPVLLRSIDGKVRGEIDVLADTGRFTFTLLSRSGTVFQHILNITVAQTLQELQDE
ncbi:MAG: hypothetical protein KAZ37_00040 [Rhodocyclaceae bacterium]|jgi:hypothetical protein|nr:hypothetical protein [Giesbergeria sp.]MBP7917623.1 hypothetical protein [Rhodocyclaceae bacterium]